MEIKMELFLPLFSCGIQALLCEVSFHNVLIYLLIKFNWVVQKGGLLNTVGALKKPVCKALHILILDLTDPSKTDRFKKNHNTCYIINILIPKT